MSDDPNAHQNAEAAKLTAYQLAKAIEHATDTVKTAIEHFSEDQRKQVLDDVLRQLKSGLVVGHGGG